MQSKFNRKVKILGKRLRISISTMITGFRPDASGSLPTSPLKMFKYVSVLINDGSSNNI
jgi:hypothetical protein